MSKFDKYLSTLKYKPNKKQLEAIKSTANTVVSAGAGSGKTDVLSKRYLYLVLDKNIDADRILTLTFTEKAASEMKERIFERLIEAEVDEMQIDKLENASIQTIDSFCARISQLGAKAYGFSSNISVAESKVVEAMESEIIKKIINQNHKNNNSIGYAIRFLTDNYDYIKLGNNSFGVYDFLSEFGRSFTPVLNAVDPVVDGVNYIKDLKNIQVPELISKIEGFLSFDIAVIESVVSIEEKEYLEIIKNCLLNILLSLKNEQFKDAFDELNEIPSLKKIKTKDCSDTIKTLDSIIQFANKVVIELAYETEYLSIMHLLKYIQGKIIEKKKDLCIVDYNDIALLAIDILKNNKDLRDQMVAKYDYIMVDEFQDNNSLQKELIYLMSYEGENKEVIEASDIKKDRLFFVGDSKQSIYKFRGADVSVFNSLSNELIADSNGRALNLDINYRSEKVLLDFFNSIFSLIFENKSNENFNLYEALHEPLKESKDNKGCSSARFMLLDKNDYSESQDSIRTIEAKAVVAEIKKIVETQSLKLPNKDRIDYSDIAILIRKNNESYEYEKELKRNNIPFLTEAMNSVLYSSIANDMYAMMQYYLYGKKDSDAYLTLLRSPFTNVDDEELYDYIDPNNELKEKKVCLELEQIVQDIKIIMTKYGITKILDYLWYDTGYRLSTLDKKADYRVMQDTYDCLWQQALIYEDGNKSLEEFLEFLRTNLNNGQIDKNINFYGRSKSGINIMTIHKSKGLQFPVVFVVGCGNNMTAKTVPELYIYRNKFNINIPNISAYRKNFYKEVKESEELAEAKRVYYVGLTRAESHLVIVGSYSLTKENKLGRTSYGFINLLEDKGFNLDLSNNTIKFKETVINKVETELAYDKLDDISCYGDYDYSRESISASRLEDIIDEDSAKALDSFKCDFIIKKNDLFTDFGTYLHESIRRVLNGEELSLELLEDQYDNSALPNKGRKTIINDALTMLKNLFNNKIFKDMLVDKENVYSEFEFTYCDKEKNLYHGSIDFLVKSKTNPIVLDFKTDKFIVDGAHKKQIYLYRDVVESLINVRPKSYIYYLRAKGEDAIVEY